jgi:hypothetical protein
MSPLYRVLALPYRLQNRHEHWRVFVKYLKQYHFVRQSFKHIKTLGELIFDTFFYRAKCLQNKVVSRLRFYQIDGR